MYNTHSTNESPQKVSYADFVVVAALRFARRAGEDIYGKIVAAQPCLDELFEACKPYLERDSY